MSDAMTSRHAVVEINCDGADITNSIRPYLKSVTYTDNEEDEADDLQIRLHDRDDVWLTKWLNDAVDAAASKAAAGDSSAAPTLYKVTPAIGLNVRSGPGTSYRKYGALVCGTVIEVSGISNGWASIDYGGISAYVSAEYIEPVDAGAEPKQQQQGPSTALKIQCVITRKNWNGDGKDVVLDCGQFELDAVDASGPPSDIVIKSTSLPYTSQIRQTEKSKAWESYNLSGIAAGIAAENGMACLYESSVDPFYERVEQYKTSDISFLSTLCHDAGISLKATNNIIVLFDQADYEAKGAPLTIRRKDGSYLKYKLNIGSAGTLYSSCRVSYVDGSGKCIEATAKVEDYNAKAKNGQQLEVQAKVSSVAEAQTLAEKHLRLHNKYGRTASFTIPGNPNAAAGVTVQLEDWGAWSGKYIIAQSKHTVDASGGYTTQIKLRQVLEGY